MRYAVALVFSFASVHCLAQSEDVRNSVACGETFVTIQAIAVQGVDSNDGKPWVVTMRKSDVRSIVIFPSATIRLLASVPLPREFGEPLDLAEFEISREVYARVASCLH